MAVTVVLASAAFIDVALLGSFLPSGLTLRETLQILLLPNLFVAGAVLALLAGGIQ